MSQPGRYGTEDLKNVVVFDKALGGGFIVCAPRYVSTTAEGHLRLDAPCPHTDLPEPIRQSLARVYHTRFMIVNNHMIGCGFVHVPSELNKKAEPEKRYVDFRLYLGLSIPREEFNPQKFLKDNEELYVTPPQHVVHEKVDVTLFKTKESGGEPEKVHGVSYYRISTQAARVRAIHDLWRPEFAQAGFVPDVNVEIVHTRKTQVA